MASEPERERIKISNTTTSRDTFENENHLHQHPANETPNAIVCGVCASAMHFCKDVSGLPNCSICNQVCGAIQLTCINCKLYICCNKNTTEKDWKPSCYHSYFDAMEPVRDQVYNQKLRVSKLNDDDQQRWLQCMWHDIVHNMSRFCVELQHTSHAELNSTSTLNRIIGYAGLGITKGLVRLFVIFQNRFNSECVAWFLALIQQNRETLASVAIETCVRLNGRLEQLKWLIHELDISDSNCVLSERVKIALTLGETAVKMGKLEVLPYFMKIMAVNPSTLQNYAFRKACKFGIKSVVESLLQDDRVDPAADDNYAIRVAIEKGHLNIVERLLQDDRVDPSANDNNAIIVAVIHGHLSVVERLLQDHRVDPSARDNRALKWASQSGRLSVVERLLQDDRVDPSARDNCALKWASQSGRLSVVERLLQDDRVDPSARNWEVVQSATDDSMIRCFYSRIGTTLCYLTGEAQLLSKFTRLRNESLLIGGLCLSNVRTDLYYITMFLPPDIVFTILSEWAILKR